MTVHGALRVALLSAAFLLGTVAFGWWAVPVVAAAWGGLSGAGERPGVTAGLSAALAWGALLLWTALSGPLGTLAGKLGAVTGLPGPAWVAATLVFPGGLAWSASSLAGAVTQGVVGMLHRGPPAQ